MKKVETAPGGHTARHISRQSTRQGFSVLALTCLLALAVWLPNLSTPVFGQDSCLNDCWLQFQACKQQQPPVTTCEDQWAICNDGCTGW